MAYRYIFSDPVGTVAAWAGGIAGAGVTSVRGMTEVTVSDLVKPEVDDSLPIAPLESFPVLPGDPTSLIVSSPADLMEGLRALLSGMSPGSVKTEVTSVLAEWDAQTVYWTAS